jgi:carboxypeptidase Q
MRRATLGFALPLALLSCVSAPAPGPAPAPAPAAPGPAPTPVVAPAAPSAAAPTPLADAHREAARKIVESALADDGAWKKLAHLTDRIGNRLSGSPQLDTAIAWAQEAMKQDGHENVHAEKVMVPRWVRGEGAASLVAPVQRPLRVLALGGAVATPAQGLTADVVIVNDLAALEALGPKAVAGKIVLFNKVMLPFTEEGGTHYEDVMEVRSRGPALASKLGASAALVRSLTARSLGTPHAGATAFPPGVKPIPSAAVTTEDADLIARAAAAGAPPRLRLRLSAKTAGEAPSANVVAELRGRERPEEVVLLAAHLDSWDVGQGAHDDGAGCVISMQALTVLRRLGLTPRRTLRVVLYTNEENGLRGAFGYAGAHKAELANHVAAIESDSGGFAPRGFRVQGSDKTVAQARDLGSLLAPVGVVEKMIEPGFGGADIMPLAPAGVPLLGFVTDASRYFDYHHTEADTLDKVDPTDLRKSLAAIAAISYALADMEGRLDPIPEGKGRQLPF